MAFDWRTLASALSSAAPILAEQKAARRQQQTLAQGELEAAGAQLKADKALGDQVTKLEASGPGQYQETSRAQYAQALKRARMESTGPNFGSDRYQSQLKDANAASAAYGARGGDFYAAIDAPERQREAESQGFTRAASVAADAGRQADMARYLAQLRAARIRANPWARLLGGIGTRIANNYDLRQRPVNDPASIRDYLPPSTVVRNA